MTKPSAVPCDETTPQRQPGPTVHPAQRPPGWGPIDAETAEAHHRSYHWDAPRPATTPSSIPTMPALPAPGPASARRRPQSPHRPASAQHTSAPKVHGSAPAAQGTAAPAERALTRSPAIAPATSASDSGLPPLLRNRAFRQFWAGEGISILGNATTTILLPLIAVVQFGVGAEWMGAIAAANWLPWLILGLPVGAWVDRLDKRTVMIAADLIAAAVMLSVPLAWAFGLLTMPHLVVAALVNGTCSVFFKAAFPGFVTRIVRREDLDHANARIFGVESVAHVAGPGLGGMIAQLAAGVLGLLIDVLSFLVSALCLWRITPSQMAPDACTQRRATSLRSDVAEGVRVVWGDRFLRFFTVQGALSNFGLTGFQALVALYFVRDLHLGAGMVGLVLMCGSAGSIVGALLTPKLIKAVGSGRAAIVFQLVAGPAALILPFAQPGWMMVAACLAYAAVGAGVVGGNVIRSSFRQKYVEPQLLGRTVTTSFVVNYGSMPLAGVAVGVLGSAWGAQPTVLVMLSIHVLAALSILFSPVRGLRDLPVRVSEQDS